MTLTVVHMGGMGLGVGADQVKTSVLASEVLGVSGDDMAPALYNNTPKPDRSRYILQQLAMTQPYLLPDWLLKTVKDDKEKNGAAVNPEAPIIEAINGQAHSGGDYAYMGCNTAHYFIDAIRAGSAIPVLSLIEVTAQYLKQQGITKVGLLATNGTVYSKNVYHPVFEKAGIEIIVPDEDVQQTVMDAIYDKFGVKKGVTLGVTSITIDNKKVEVPEDQHPTNRFKKAVDHLKSKGATLIIEGCTEVHMALTNKIMPEANLLEPMDLIQLANVKIPRDPMMTYLKGVNFYGTHQEIQKLAQDINETEEKRKQLEESQRNLANEQESSKSLMKRSEIMREIEQIDEALPKKIEALTEKIDWLTKTKEDALDQMASVLKKNPITPEEVRKLEAAREEPALSKIEDRPIINEQPFKRTRVSLPISIIHNGSRSPSGSDPNSPSNSEEMSRSDSPSKKSGLEKRGGDQDVYSSDGGSEEEIKINVREPVTIGAFNEALQKCAIIQGKGGLGWVARINTKEKEPVYRITLENVGGTEQDIKDAYDTISTIYEYLSQELPTNTPVLRRHMGGLGNGKRPTWSVTVSCTDEVAKILNTSSGKDCHWQAKMLIPEVTLLAVK